jgi:hypothetical protein
MNTSARDDLQFVEEFSTDTREYLFCELRLKDFSEYDERINWVSYGERFQEHQKKKRDLYEEYGTLRRNLGKKINRVRVISNRLTVSTMKVIVQRDGGVAQVDCLDYLFADGALNKNVALDFLNELHGVCERATDVELYRILNPDPWYHRGLKKLKGAASAVGVSGFLKLLDNLTGW